MVELIPLRASHVTVATVRSKLESTGQIDQLKKTKGADGKERPAHRTIAKPTLEAVIADITKDEIAPKPKPSTINGSVTETDTEEEEYVPRRPWTVADFPATWAAASDQLCKLAAELVIADEGDWSDALCNAAEVQRRIRAAAERGKADFERSYSESVKAAQISPAVVEGSPPTPVEMFPADGSIPDILKRSPSEKANGGAA